MSIEIRSLAGLSREDLRLAMIAGFAGYAIPMAPSPEAFDLMMRQRGLTPEASRVAMEDGRIVAFWYVSHRGDQAYLIASGTEPSHRGCGLSQQLGDACLTHARDCGLRSFQTEVLDGNDGAARLYDRLGFKLSRRLDSYDLADLSGPALPQRQWADVAGAMAEIRDWEPSWQNGTEALAAIAGNVTVVAEYAGEQVVGVAALIRPSGVLAQIAVHPDWRRRGIARRLLNGLGRPTLRVLNADGADAGFAAFFSAQGATRSLGQRELWQAL